MAKIEQYSRIINHGVTTAGTQFTVPTSNDHTDETWQSTDLYIGEIGINLTDDKIYMRTNNGIIQIATGTSSGSTSSTTGIFVFNSPDIQISSTYSADSLSRRSGYFTDLGTTTLRWKDLYLGGSSTGLATINANAGLLITESSDAILVTKGIVNNNAPIIIDYKAENTTKDQQLHLNSRTTEFSGTSFENVSIGCVNATASNVTSTVLIGASNVGVEDSLSNVIHLGPGYSRKDKYSEQVVAGGSLAVRGTGDDGSGQYNDCDWTTKQSQLRTSNALTTTLASIPWGGIASTGNIIQVKAYIVGVVIDAATYAYHAEVLGCYTINDSGILTEVGVPIINASSANWPGAKPDVEMSADASNVYISVTGVGTTTIQWLCSYSYHKLINIV